LREALQSEPGRCLKAAATIPFWEAPQAGPAVINQISGQASRFAYERDWLLGTVLAIQGCYQIQPARGTAPSGSPDVIAAVEIPFRRTSSGNSMNGACPSRANPGVLA